MRSVPVAMMLSIAVLLAGCAGGNGDHEDETYTCPNGTVLNLEDFPEHHNATFNPASKCPGGSGTGSTTNTTTQAPNVPPVLVVKTFDFMGNETKVTLLGGNLTFSAEGSSDPDGEISGIAVTVTDSNQTRTASLYDAVSRQFKTATFMFDRPGVVNVTVAMVDDRAGFTVNQTNVYVNHMQVKDAVSISAGSPSAAFNACNGGMDFGPVQGNLYESQFFKTYSFDVAPGATFIEATSEQGAARLTICKPIPGATGATTHEPVSGTARSSVVTYDDAELSPSTGTSNYHVGATTVEGTGPTDVGVTIIVHYEPREEAAVE